MKHKPDYKKLSKKDDLRITCDRCDHYEKRSRRTGMCLKTQTPTQPLSTACERFVLSKELKRAGEMMTNIAKKAFKNMRER